MLRKLGNSSLNTLQRRHGLRNDSCVGGSRRSLTSSRKRVLSTSTTSTSNAVNHAASGAVKENGKDSLMSLKSIVKDPRIRQALPWIGHGAYCAIASGFLMTDMLQLRVALVGGYTGLVAFHTLHAKPLLIPLRWSAVFVLVNAAAAGALVMDRFGSTLSEEDEDLYQEHFSQFSRGQFHQLLSLAKEEEIPQDTVLTKEGQVCDKVYFLKSGLAQVFHNQRFAAYIDHGGFVNDVAFQQEGEDVGAYGTVKTQAACVALVWNKEELHQHLKSRPEMDRNMKYTLSNHLMKSLLKQREARHTVVDETMPVQTFDTENLSYHTKQSQ